MLWDLARSRHGHKGPWLFGNYSLADVFYAPVAMRMTGYGLPMSALAKDYVNAHLADPAFCAWRALGLEDSYSPWPYPTNLTKKLWPGDSDTALLDVA